MSSPSDLTARARIRDSALKLFAERGIDRATVRDIALDAGVSSGLLRHHFGSKEGLRDACDEFALGEITRIGSRFTTFQVLDRIDPGVRLLQRYLIQSMLEGSAAGNALFDRMIEYAEQWLATTDIKVADPRAFVAVLSAMKLSMFTMRDQLSRVLGEDVDEPSGWARMLQASVEIFSQPIVTPAQAEQVRNAFARLDSPTPEE
ncbi:MAG TPA: TetR family transcriptional regulator [Actinoplanes sp.]